MKKRLLILTFSILFLSACAKTNSETQAEGTILYVGTVTEINDKSILMSDLDPVDNTEAPSFTEVVLLTVPPTKLKKGDTLEVILAENTPTTRSLPPQIPSDSIIEIRIPAN